MIVAKLLSWCRILISFIISPGMEGRGGEVGLCLSKLLTYTSFEYMHINFSLTNKLYKIIVLYGPPLKTNSNNFTNEFYGLMSFLFDENRKVYVCGDFNIWAEDDTDNYTKRFLEVVGNFNYKNVVGYVNLLPGLDI